MRVSPAASITTVSGDDSQRSLTLTIFPSRMTTACCVISRVPSKILALQMTNEEGVAAAILSASGNERNTITRAARDFRAEVTACFLWILHASPIQLIDIEKILADSPGVNAPAFSPGFRS